MKNFCCFLAIFLSATCFAGTQYRLTPRGGTFVCTSYNHGPYHVTKFKLGSFDIYTLDKNVFTLYGTVEKLNEWTRAYTFKMDGETQSIHYSSFFSFGSFMDCMKKYEVLDDQGLVIGYIEGNYHTNARAEFFFLNEKREVFATANMHASRPNLTIRSPEGKTLVTGTRVLYNSAPHPSYFPQYEYFWNVNEEENDSIDPRFLWPFVGFVGEVWWFSPYNSTEIVPIR